MFKLGLVALLGSVALYGVEGTYTGSGMDPYAKSTYTVTATFTKDKNGVYQATWDEMENGTKTHYVGTGLKQGEYLSFMYQNSGDDSDEGLQMYKIKGDALDGSFVGLGKNVVGQEKLTRTKK